MNMRNRRMDAEWQLLQALADANKTVFATINRLENEFRLVMRESPARVESGREVRVEAEHALRYVYPRYYPALPLEGYFVRPVLHINVDPVTGFVCLWQDYRPAQTIVDAILITRAVMACEVANWDLAHRMQPDTVMEWPGRGTLPMPSLTIPAVCRRVLPHSRAGNRRRLSCGPDNQMPQESDFAFSDTQ